MVCSAIMEANNGAVDIEGMNTVHDFQPIMWRHSDHDVYHALIDVGPRHVILCQTDEFDEQTLKRIKPLSMEGDGFSISVKGDIYRIVELDDGRYEILNTDGTIVKDEEVEAHVFNYMTFIR